MSSARLPRHPAVAYLFVVRPMRFIGVTAQYTLALALASCVDLPAPIQPRAGDPSLSGLSYLLGESDFRAVLRIARERLATIAPQSPVFRVIVLSPSRVEAFYCPTYLDRELYAGDVYSFEQNKPQIGYLLIERDPAGWRIAPGHGSKVLNDRGIIING